MILDVQVSLDDGNLYKIMKLKIKSTCGENILYYKNIYSAKRINVKSGLI